MTIGKWANPNISIRRWNSQGINAMDLLSISNAFAIDIKVLKAFLSRLTLNARNIIQGYFVLDKRWESL
jgi:hypothetical protein